MRHVRGGARERLQRAVVIAVLAGGGWMAGATLPASALACGHTPRDAVVRYYDGVNSGHFRRAWSCLRTASRDAFGGYNAWRTGYQTTAYACGCAEPRRPTRVPGSAMCGSRSTRAGTPPAGRRRNG